MRARGVTARATSLDYTPAPDSGAVRAARTDVVGAAYEKDPRLTASIIRGHERGDAVSVPIASEDDILTARQQARSLAVTLGFWTVEQTFIAIAISELALNILQYAGKGDIVLSGSEKQGTRGIVIVARDEGPGIADIALAMQEGYSTSGGPGLGLSGAKRLMDEFELVSSLGKGTTVTMKKWVR